MRRVCWGERKEKKPKKKENQKTENNPNSKIISVVYVFVCGVTGNRNIYIVVCVRR